MTGQAAAAATFVVLMLPLPLTAAGDPLSSPGTAGARSCVEAIGYPVTQRPHVAFRRLEADNPKSGRQGWMEVRTTLGNDGLLSVEVLAECGADYIRNKVLRAALQREQDLIARRVKEHESSAPDVTSCGEPQPDESGLLRVAIGNTGRKDDGIVIGHMFLQPATGDLVRVAGRLSKNPSFWISQVDVEWNYARIGKDNVLPVSLYSTAKVKMFGVSTFRMTYDYLSVDGQPVSNGSRASR
jgi:hypothetical protein